MKSSTPIDFLAERQPTQTTSFILWYLQQFFCNKDWEEDIAFKKQLQQCQLDYSPASLQRIDKLLSSLRQQKAPAYETFLSETCNQNFLLLLAYYCGEMKGRARKQAPRWQKYEEFIAENDGLQNIFPYCFEYLFVCRFYDENGEEYNHFPLVSICHCLFEKIPDKSVFFSSLQVLPKSPAELKRPLPEAPPHSLAFSGKELIAQTPKGHLPYLQMLPPDWIWGDPLMTQLQQLAHLYQRGRVVWGCLVQANSQLFEVHPDSSPAEVIYDPSGRTPPEVLHQLARRLFSLKKNRDDAPRQLAEYGEHLENEISRLFTELTIDHQHIRAATTFIWRLHLPNGILSMPFFPVLISDKTPAITILPALYWQHTTFYQDWFKRQDAILSNQEETTDTTPSQNSNRDMVEFFSDFLRKKIYFWQSYEVFLFPQHHELPMFDKPPSYPAQQPTENLVNPWIPDSYANSFEESNKPSEEAILRCAAQLQADGHSGANDDIQKYAKLRVADFSYLLEELSNPQYAQRLHQPVLPKAIISALKTERSTLEERVKIVRYLFLQAEKDSHEIYLNERQPGEPQLQSNQIPQTTAAMLCLAYLYTKGIYVPQSLVKANSWARYAAQLGDWRASRFLGEMLIASPEAAPELWKQEAYEAATHLSLALRGGVATDKYLSALEESQQITAYLHYQPAVLEIAKQQLLLAHEQGHPAAQTRLLELLKNKTLPEIQTDIAIINVQTWLLAYMHGNPEVKPWVTEYIQKNCQDTPWVQDFFDELDAQLVDELDVQSVDESEHNKPNAKKYLLLAVLLPFFLVWKALSPPKDKTQTSTKQLITVEKDRLPAQLFTPQAKTSAPTLSADGIEQKVQEIAQQLPRPANFNSRVTLLSINNTQPITIEVKGYQSARLKKDIMFDVKGLYCYEPLFKSISTALPVKLVVQKSTGEFWYDIEVGADNCQ